MAYSSAYVFGNHLSIAGAISDKLNALTIANLYTIQVVKISTDHFLAIIIYD